jgi:hypothetical protein
MLQMIFKQMLLLDKPYFWIDTWNVCHDIEPLKLQQLPSMPAIYHGLETAIVAERRYTSLASSLTFGVVVGLIEVGLYLRDCERVLCDCACALVAVRR